VICVAGHSDRSPRLILRTTHQGALTYCAGVKKPFIETVLALKGKRRAIESSLILISLATLLHGVGKSGV
jgi:hypothetical protein